MHFKKLNSYSTQTFAYSLLIQKIYFQNMNSGKILVLNLYIFFENLGDIYLKFSEQMHRLHVYYDLQVSIHILPAPDDTL